MRPVLITLVFIVGGVSGCLMYPFFGDFYSTTLGVFLLFGLATLGASAILAIYSNFTRSSDYERKTLP